MMTLLNRTLSAGLTLVALFGAPLAACGQPSSVETDRGAVQVDVVASGLESLWGFAFLPDGSILATELPGRLRMIHEGGHVMEAPIAGTPEVFARGQGGLLDVVLHPDFERNQLVYLTYAKPVDGNSTTAVARGRLDGMQLVDVADIFVADSRGRGHYGSRLAFDAEGYLFVTVGDRQANPNEDQANHPAQDRSNHHGTVNRLHDDGSIPADNPFVGQDGIEPSIWSYGHRNPQGMSWDPATGRLWINEHGPQGGDELNLVLPGRNYGWPVIGYGVNYGGNELHEGTHQEGMEQPVHYWVPSIATSGMLVYSGSAFPEWQGNLFVGGLNGEQVARLVLDGDQVVAEETIYRGHGRIRDIRQGPDGAIYLGIDGPADQAAIVRLTPAGNAR
ncbi:MAG: PQQ-dependent sugar dehydrogenase [Bacteroidetes bacterium]|nr:PQQ-dependent sugar dehydrogenase [Bacteroidota bacterium]